MFNFQKIRISGYLYKKTLLMPWNTEVTNVTPDNEKNQNSIKISLFFNRVFYSISKYFL